MRQQLRARAILFDLDGVLVDSSECVYKAWDEWAKRHGLDTESTFTVGHGRTTLDHIRAVAPELATTEQASIVDDLERNYIKEITAQPGALDAMVTLGELGIRWAVVTSCAKGAAKLRLAAAGLPMPEVLVTADDVNLHKPAPDGYRLGCNRLGVSATDAAVFEDAPVGIVAARRAGARVIALATTHRIADLNGAEAIASNLAQLRFEPHVEGVTILMTP